VSSRFSILDFVSKFNSMLASRRVKTLNKSKIGCMLLFVSFSGVTLAINC
jgi:hypothetical protein